MIKLGYITPISKIDHDFYKTHWLKVVANSIAEDPRPNRLDEWESERIWRIFRVSSHYFKAVDRYESLFEKSLKDLDGFKRGDFDDSRVDAILEIYRLQISAIANDTTQFCKESINRLNIETLNFKSVELSDSIILSYLRTDFVNKIAAYEEDRELRNNQHEITLFGVSRTNLNRLEGKLGKFLRYATIDEAIEHARRVAEIKGGYRFKKRVKDLDALIDEMLIVKEQNIVNPVKAKQTTDELVDEAVNGYEILSNPVYLLDENSFRNAVRNKIKRKLHR
ncbi:MAG: hypothetical protein GVY08_04155 [Bacteroidetes bacterium]|jgi:hypothetical protein|nr:hypothetical protein [Bacteroidota bacterium]